MNIPQKTHPSSDFVDATVESTGKKCAANTTEKEKHMFNPSTKGVVDEIATKVGLDQEISTPIGVVKRGITFTETEDILIAEKSPSPAHETVTPASGSRSPIKKMKNVAGHK